MTEAGDATSTPRSASERSTIQVLKQSLWRGWTRVILVGSLTGIVGGMGTFTFTRMPLSPFDAAWFPLILVAIGGGYLHVLSKDMRSGAYAMLVGFVVGMGFNIAAWVSPVYILPYSDAAQDIAVMAQLQQSLVSVVMIYSIIYLAGYLTVASISGAFS